MNPPGPLFGPQFSTYERSDVAWLLTDISSHSLERPVRERERAIQGGAHYSSSLPIEYQPSSEYLQIYEESLRSSSRRLADAVASLATRLRRRRGDQVTLVSLARAGTPVGILLRRYTAAQMSLDWPHYTISIIRGRGIDTEALSYIASRHHPSSIVFVDGWTGKGAIARELTSALGHADTPSGIPDELAVLADPGRCAHVSGTRDDFLVASACLNSTVSGLVSRTVLRQDLTGSGFHGAKYYSELASHDRSRAFIETIAAHFPTAVATGGCEHARDFSGWQAMSALGREMGVHDINLIKPGVGETTRVLLRRVPWLVLVDPSRASSPDLTHIHRLAADRGVPVVEQSTFPYACVGLVKPVGQT